MGGINLFKDIYPGGLEKFLWYANKGSKEREWGSFRSLFLGMSVFKSGMGGGFRRKQGRVGVAET
jgi:hypothetical protein